MADKADRGKDLLNPMFAIKLYYQIHFHQMTNNKSNDCLTILGQPGNYKLKAETKLHDNDLSTRRN
jgi:hypothetical protein